MSDGSDDPGGYGKAPKQHRFGQGQPRNRRGRPPGAKNTKTIVHEIAHERHVVQEDGQTRSYTTAQLLLKTLSRKAMKGDVPASKLLDKYRAVYQLEQVETPGGFLVVFETMAVEQWERHSGALNARREYEDSQDPEREGRRDGALIVTPAAGE